MPAVTVPRLRPYRDSDAPFVAALARLAFGEYSPRAGAPSVRAATLPGVDALVAELAGAAVGFAMSSFRVPADGATVVSLDAIAVDAVHRGQGVGRALLAGAERHARKRRAVELRLVTAEANLAALDLFLRSGFEIVERLERYYPRGQNAVVMRKALV